MSDIPALEQVEDRGPFTTTRSGKRFYINEVNVRDIPLGDIAHALSMTCRFNGHILSHYSVAEHSVYVSRLVEMRGGSRDEQLAGLLHDVSEAFLPDVPRPYKPLVPEFVEAEDRILRAASESFGFPYPLPEVVKYYDAHIVRYEASRLYLAPPDWIEFYDDLSSFMDEITDGGDIGLDALEARWAFVRRYEELMWGEIG